MLSKHHNNITHPNKHTHTQNEMGGGGENKKTTTTTGSSFLSSELYAESHKHKPKKLCQSVTTGDHSMSLCVLTALLIR